MSGTFPRGNSPGVGKEASDGVAPPLAGADADHVLDHFDLFRGPEYRTMLENKRKNFEDPVADAEVERVREWTKTPEYREKNFAQIGRVHV